MDVGALSVDRENLRGHVLKLAQEPRHSLHHPEGHARAQEYISHALGQAGLQVATHSFAGGGRTGMNLVGRKAGTDPSLAPLRVTAHYDTVAGSPGADDNASGVAALLEVARILGGMTVRRTVEIVAFDMEEVQPDGASLVGSTAFVDSMIQGEGCDGVYNLEMVGYTSGPNSQTYPPGFGVIFPRVFGQVQARDFRGDFLTVVARGRGAALARRLEEAARQWAGELPLVTIDAPAYLPLLPDIFRSDHAPFWAAGFPAVMLTDTANFRNPNYHLPGDVPATLDLEFLARVAQALVGAVAQHAEAALGG